MLRHLVVILHPENCTYVTPYVEVPQINTLGLLMETTKKTLLLSHYFKIQFNPLIQNSVVSQMQDIPQLQK